MRAQRTLLAALALVLAPGYALAQSTAPVGSQPLSSQTASKFFHGVGLSAALGFGHATATLAASGPAADPATGPFFYPDLNLSFQVAAGRCSMVSASDAAATEMATAFADATALESSPDAVISLDPTSGRAELLGPAGTRMMVEPFIAPSGEPYFRALLGSAR